MTEQDKRSLEERYIGGGGLAQLHLVNLQEPGQNTFVGFAGLCGLGPNRNNREVARYAACHHCVAGFLESELTLHKGKVGGSILLLSINDELRLLSRSDIAWRRESEIVYIDVSLDEEQGKLPGLAAVARRCRPPHVRDQAHDNEINRAIILCDSGRHRGERITHRREVQIAPGVPIGASGKQRCYSYEIVNETQGYPEGHGTSGSPALQEDANGTIVMIGLHVLDGRLAILDPADGGFAPNDPEEGRATVGRFEPRRPAEGLATEQHSPILSREEIREILDTMRIFENKDSLVENDETGRGSPARAAMVYGVVARSQVSDFVSDVKGVLRCCSELRSNLSGVQDSAFSSLAAYGDEVGKIGVIRESLRILLRGVVKIQPGIALSGAVIAGLRACARDLQRPIRDKSGLKARRDIVAKLRELVEFVDGGALQARAAFQDAMKPVLDVAAAPDDFAKNLPSRELAESVMKVYRDTRNVV